MSDNKIFHDHHIIPKHVDPLGYFKDYTVKVTMAEHAEIHGLLYDEYGRWQDFLAWQLLTKQINHRDYYQSLTDAEKEEHRELSRKYSLGNKHALGKRWKLKDATKKKMKLSALKRPPRTEEHKEKIKNNRKGKGCGLKNAMANLKNRQKVGQSKIGRKGLYHKSLGSKRIHPNTELWNKLISEGWYPKLSN